MSGAFRYRTLHRVPTPCRCHRMAERAANLRMQSILIDMARTWQRLSLEVEQSLPGPLFQLPTGGGLGGSVCEHPLGFDWKVGSRGIPGQSVGGWKLVGRAVGSMKLGTGPFPRAVAPLNLRGPHFDFRHQVTNSIQTAASKSAQA